MDGALDDPDGALGDAKAVVVASEENIKDYFQELDGQKFAGRHLLVEVWDADNLNDPKVIDDILTRGARASGATVLHRHFHHFSPFGGVSGVLVLAESHVSIHTWPERSYAAIDLFMCGRCDPHDAIGSLKQGFAPGRIDVCEYRRGIVDE